MKALIRSTLIVVSLAAASLVHASPVTYVSSDRSVWVHDIHQPAGAYSGSFVAGAYADSVSMLSGSETSIPISASQTSQIDAAAGVFSGQGAATVGFSVQNEDEAVSESVYNANFFATSAMNYSLRGTLGAFMDGGIGMARISLLNTDTNVTVFSFVNTSDWGSDVVTSNGALAAGNYSLGVMAMVNGDPQQFGGSFYGGTANFDFHFEVSAVPEPETYAMLLAGLGILTSAARRRKARS